MDQNMENIDFHTFFSVTLKHGKYWFSHIFFCNFKTMVSTAIKLWFLSSLEHFWSDPIDNLSKVVFLLRKCTKSSKNKVGGSTPLSITVCRYRPVKWNKNKRTKKCSKCVVLYLYTVDWFWFTLLDNFRYTTVSMQSDSQKPQIEQTNCAESRLV